MIDASTMTSWYSPNHRDQFVIQREQKAMQEPKAEKCYPFFSFTSDASGIIQYSEEQKSSP